MGLHWPNDVFVAGKKMAGVLIDVLPDGRHVVGIGLNVNNSLAAAPDDVRARAASLCELAGRTFDRTAVLLKLLDNLQAAVRESAASPEIFGQRFNELCLQLGQESDDRSRQPAHHRRLRWNRGRRRFAARHARRQAEVLFGRVAIGRRLHRARACIGTTNASWNLLFSRPPNDQRPATIPRQERTGSDTQSIDRSSERARRP